MSFYFKLPFKFYTLKKEKQEKFLDNFYYPRDCAVLDSVNSSRHFLAKALPYMVRSLGKKELNRRVQEALESVK